MAKQERPEQPAKKSGGQILKETREAKGISLNTVHHATKIPMDALKAIEEGYTIRTLSPFYLKGFMKMYAQYLGLDPMVVLVEVPTERQEKPVRREFKPQSWARPELKPMPPSQPKLQPAPQSWAKPEPKPEPKPVPPSQPKLQPAPQSLAKPEQQPLPAAQNLPKPAPLQRPAFTREKPAFTREQQKMLVIVLGIIIIAGVVYKVAGYLHQKGASLPRPGKSARLQTVAKAKAKRAEIKKVVTNKSSAKNAAARLSKPGSKNSSEAEDALESGPAKGPTVKPVTAPRPQPVKPAPAAPVEKTVPAAPAVAAQTPPAAEPARTVRLTIKTRKTGWLQVKVDGNLVFQSTIKEGDTETWQAKEKIELSGKNIHNLDFEVNGKVLGTLGRADRSARRVVISKDGLNVIE